MNLLIETSMLKLLTSGRNIILCSIKPLYNKGEILGVKETYRYDRYGQVHYAADEDVEYGAYSTPGNSWRFANSLPEKYIKRHVRVENIKIISGDEYEVNYKPSAILYNRKEWLVPNSVDFRTIYDTQSASPGTGERMYLYELKLI